MDNHIIPNNIYNIAFKTGLPILAEDQTHNLVYDDGEYRVWLSRMTLADYDHNWDAYIKEKIMFEKRVDDKWILADRYGKRFYK
jgi:hypothetical protein